MSCDRKFNTRAFVALMLVLSALGLPITGMANHERGFEDLTFGRHAWMSAHNCLAILFVVFGVWHMWLNRRALWNHIRGGASSLSTVGREALVAMLVVAVTLFLFVGHAFHLRG